MFFNKPKISKTWKSGSGTGYSIEDDAGRKVVLWFNSDSDDFIKARTGGSDLRVVEDDLSRLAQERLQRQGSNALGVFPGLANIGGILGRKQ